MKTIIRESIAMIILICAIMLILVTLFLTISKENSIEISSATYQMSKEEQNILKEKQKIFSITKYNNVIIRIHSNRR